MAQTGDRGSLAVELSILFPLVLALTLGGVQVAMWFQARSMCHAAAQAGVRAARVLDAPTDAGRSAARGYLTSTAGDTVLAPAVAQQTTPTTVSVTCIGTAERVIPIPGLAIRVRQSASARRERFTTP